MRISHTYKFVFIAITRTGSTSIRSALDPFTDITSTPEGAFWHHTNPQKLKEEFDKRDWDWNSYFKFAFVRNPWDRLVSTYFYDKKKLGENVEEIKQMSALHREWIEGLESLHQKYPSFCEFACAPTHQCQKDVLYDKDENMLVDFIGRFESIEEDFDFICKKIGIEASLKKLNSTEHPHYSRLYDSNSIEQVRKICRKDIDFFNYKFEREYE